MSTPVASILFPSGGKTTYGANDKRRVGVIRERVALAAAAAGALSQQLPANSRVISSQFNVSAAFTPTTATRIGIGTTADPDAFQISSLLVTATSYPIGTNFGPVFQQGSVPIFSNSVIGTAGGASSTAAFTLTTFSGQTVAPIPANFLKPGDIIRIRGGGTIAWGTDGTFILKVLAGTDIVIQAATITPVDGDMFTFDVDIVIRSIGGGGAAAGSFTSAGRTFVGTAGSAAGAADVPSGGFLALTNLDTTAAFTPTVTGIFSTSQAAHGGTMNQFSIEVIRPVLPVSSAATALAVTTLNNAGISTGTGSGSLDVEIEFEQLDTMQLT